MAKLRMAPLVLIGVIVLGGGGYAFMQWNPPTPTPAPQAVQAPADVQPQTVQPTYQPPAQQQAEQAPAPAPVPQRRTRQDAGLDALLNGGQK